MQGHGDQQVEVHVTAVVGDELAAGTVDLAGIELGDESDAFAADLRFWSVADYQAQWREGIARLAAGQPSTALVTSYRGGGAAFHSMWPMWRIGQTVYVQERLVLDDTVAATDVSQQFYDRVGERHTESDDGDAISEWSIPFADVLAFLANG